MWQFSLVTLLATASAQIPSLGWCPDYLPMASFNMNRFLGTWYEAERYFTVSELVSRCVATKYEKTPEGRIIVNNEITNSLTGYKRGMDGYLQLIGREGEARFIVKYSSLPVPYDTEYSVLDTDYDSYAVVWSCSGIGPVHTQNAWILTRDRLAPSSVMQQAYAAIDKYRITRAFFVKTNQADCTVLPDPAADPESKNSPVPVEAEAKHAGIISDVAELVKKVFANPYGLSISVNRDNSSSQVDVNILPQAPHGPATERQQIPENTDAEPEGEERVVNPLIVEESIILKQVPEIILESSEKKEDLDNKKEETFSQEQKLENADRKEHEDTSGQPIV